MNKKLKIFAAATIAALSVSASAMAQETVLRMSSWLPPAHPIVKGMMVPWAAKVKEVTEGRVSVQILDAPLGPPPAHFDLAANGIADLTYGVHGYTPGRFKLTQIAELPFLATDATSLSVAYWRLYESTLAKANEHRGSKVLGVFTHGPGLLYTTDRAVSPLSELKGAKIRVAGSITNQLVQAMDMVAIQAPAPQSYEILSGGIADGIVFPTESIPFFKLDGLLSNGLRVEGGLYNVSFFFIANNAKFSSLSEADQKAIEAISGEAFSRLAGAAWNAADAWGLEQMEGKVTIHDATAEERAQLEEATRPMFDGVAKSYGEKGIDFEVAMDMLQKEVAAVASEK
ncbi:Bacterial extracellular solute-binding protein, family 7 [Pseudovibrio sp. Ad46]|uniref:TRAP transporter substrate-binding protein n=1 Tax=Pseudovibrio sp. Ad46 TaxID=989432 RepID=UPI0007AE86E3|nr:TRAP transporter substrate-binding protein [Pseudovibrio sp. Ad46]KZK85542.1 Bacterial extracellular solute-binding protein, family 7 [Pseudovibrio sp. Ad46]